MMNVPSIPPKPKPPMETAPKIHPNKQPFVPPAHLTHKPFRNRGLESLKVNLKRR